jgi:hypothetical protein
MKQLQDFMVEVLENEVHKFNNIISIQHRWVNKDETLARALTTMHRAIAYKTNNISSIIEILQELFFLSFA